MRINPLRLAGALYAFAVVLVFMAFAGPIDPQTRAIVLSQAVTLVVIAVAVNIGTDNRRNA